MLQPLNLNPSTWKQDGVDHVNIGLHVATELGRKLSTSYKCDFVHPVLGHFASIESLWMYLSSVERDDRLRTLYGKPLRELAKQLTRSHVTNFRAMVVDSMRIRIENDPMLLELLVDCELPLDYYYHKSVKGSEDKLAIRVSYAQWLVSGILDIRDSLQRGTELELSPYMDEVVSELYKPLLVSQV